MNSKIYTQGEFIEFCRSVFGYYKPTANNNIEVLCPRCKKDKHQYYNKKKLAIKLDTHQIKCWVCGYKSRDLTHLLRAYFPGRYKEYIENYFDGEVLNPDNTSEEDKVPEILTLPPNFRLLATADPTLAVVKGALNYLKTRGAASMETLWYWKVGIISGATKETKHLLNRVIIPSYNNRGELNYYSARSTNKWLKPKYDNPETDRKSIVFNEINIDWSKELTIVEGVFDLIKCNDNATCLLSSELTPDYKLFQEIVKNKTPVVLALDPEASKKTLGIAKLLFEYDIPVGIVKLKPEQEDVGELSKQEFERLLPCAQTYTPNFHLKSKIASII